jgi:thiamine biosynthesis protein ThiS
MVKIPRKEIAVFLNRYLLKIMKFLFFSNVNFHNLKFMSQIKFFLNGEERFLQKEITILQLIQDLNLDVKKIAVEKDLEIILPQQFVEVLINENCKIEIVHFIGGG